MAKFHCDDDDKHKENETVPFLFPKAEKESAKKVIMHRELMCDDAYVADRGSHCPYCNSSNVRQHLLPEPVGDGAFYRGLLDCRDCNKQWWTRLELKGWMPQDEDDPGEVKAGVGGMDAN